MDFYENVWSELLIFLRKNKMIKKVLFIFIFFSIIPISYWCKYSSEISQCNSQIKKFLPKDGWDFIWVWSSIKWFDDFVCLQAPSEIRTAQIAMDMNFREIDAEVDTYLEELESQKDRFFWKDSEFNYYQWVDYIYDKVNEFEEKYIAACKLSIKETWECTKNTLYDDADSQSSISIWEAIEYLWNWKWSWWKCYDLVKMKSDILSSVSYNILLLNQQSVQKDQQTLYEQETRTKYNKVLDIMMINIWYIERIWQKTPSFTKNPL